MAIRHSKTPVVSALSSGIVWSCPNMTIIQDTLLSYRPVFEPMSRTLIDPLSEALAPSERSHRQPHILKLLPKIVDENEPCAEVIRSE